MQYNNTHFMQFERGRTYTNGASSSGASSSFRRPFMDGPAGDGPVPSLSGPGFDIIEWHPAYQSCQRYFLDYAQHEPGTQALCALINIRLPYQWHNNPITSSRPADQAAPGHSGSHNPGNFLQRPSSSFNSPNRPRSSNAQTPPVFVSLIPYIRRLIVTGFDKPPILHGFFGDDYARGVLPHLECERRNYLFAAKHGGWRTCKKQYDSGSGGDDGDETVPFMKPLDEAKMEELNAAEKSWSNWLAMEDWMVGPRAPEEGQSGNRRQGGGGQDDSNLPDGLGEAYNRR